MNSVDRLLKAHDRLAECAFFLACVALLALLGAYLSEVTARYFFNAPTRWASDIVGYALSWATSLALPLVTREGGHVAITSVIEKLSPQRLHETTRLIAWASAVTLLGTAVLFIRIAVDQHAQGIETVAAVAIPKWWLTSAAAYGIADSGLHLLRQGLGLESARAGHELDV
jgi:TRAP-type C4-dicarboxylate transport system permease small subunit